MGDPPLGSLALLLFYEHISRTGKKSGCVLWKDEKSRCQHFHSTRSSNIFQFPDVKMLQFNLVDIELSLPRQFVGSLEACVSLCGYGCLMPSSFSTCPGTYMAVIQAEEKPECKMGNSFLFKFRFVYTCLRKPCP